MDEKKLLTDSGLKQWHELLLSWAEGIIEELKTESISMTYNETGGIIDISKGGSQAILTWHDDGIGNVTMILPVEASMTDDGDGNVVVSGLTIADDGNGNVTIV